MPRIFSGRVILFLASLLIFDLTLAPLFRVGSVKPILLYLALLHAAFHWDSQKILPMALAVGLLRDLAGSHPFGLETALLVAAALALEFFVQQIDRHSLLMRLGFAFVFIFFVNLSHLAFASFLGMSYGLSSHGLSVALGTAFTTAAFLPALTWMASRWFGERVPLKQYELFH